MKRILTALCVALTVLFTMPTVAQAAEGTVNFTVKADKSEANPGDTVNFSILLGAVDGMGGVNFALKIPEGLTIDEASVKMPDGVAELLDTTEEDINFPTLQNKLVFDLFSHSSYKGDSDLCILTFSCKVNDDCAFESKSLTLEVETCFDDTTAMNDFQTNVIPADFTVAKKKIAVTGVTLDQTTLTLQEGESAQLTATVEPANADIKAVAWDSDNKDSVTVTADGKVTAVKEGKANITVTTQDGNKTAVCVVTVPHQHNMSALTEAKPATCVTDGNVAYYTCTKCNKKFEDQAGTKELANVVIAATGHKAGSEWKTDANNHWKECVNAGCGIKLEEAPHSFSWIIDKAATEDATGLSHEECVCGLKRSENTVIPKLDHVHVGITHHAAVAATCVAEGQKEYWTCASPKCADKLYGDAKCQIVVTKESLTLPKDPNAHAYDNDGDGTCNLCGNMRFYEVIKGAGSTYTSGSEGTVELTVNGEYDQFKELRINDTVVDRANYTVTAGSTVITLKNSYLKTLKAGEYKVEVLYKDGKSAQTQFTIEEEDEDDEAEIPAAGTDGSKAVSPKTGDWNGTSTLWAGLAVLSILIMSGVIVYRKKCK